MSRPRRTRVYNSNYNLGESYYKPALDRLDRKYSGRPLEKESSPAVPQELQDRYERAFENDDLTSARRRAEKFITENTVFDSRGAAITRSSLNPEDDIDEEIAGTLKRIRANKKLNSRIEDIDLEGTVSAMTTKRNFGMSEKLLDSVGINESSIRRIRNGENGIKPRQPVVLDDDMDAPVMSKWTALRDEETSAAAHRAKLSKARIQDLEDEMDQINERQAARERRSKQIRAFIGECDDVQSSSSSIQSSMKSTKLSARSEKKMVSF